MPSKTFHFLYRLINAIETEHKGDFLDLRIRSKDELTKAEQLLRDRTTAVVGESRTGLVKRVLKILFVAHCFCVSNEPEKSCELFEEAEKILRLRSRKIGSEKLKLKFRLVIIYLKKIQSYCFEDDVCELPQVPDLQPADFVLELLLLRIQLMAVECSLLQEQVASFALIEATKHLARLKKFKYPFRFRHYSKAVQIADSDLKLVEAKIRFLTGNFYKSAEILKKVVLNDRELRSSVLHQKEAWFLFDCILQRSKYCVDYIPVPARQSGDVTSSIVNQFNGLSNWRISVLFQLLIKFRTGFDGSRLSIECDERKSQDINKLTLEFLLIFERRLQNVVLQNSNDGAEYAELLEDLMKLSIKRGMNKCLHYILKVAKILAHIRRKSHLSIIPFESFRALRSAVENFLDCKSPLVAFWLKLCSLELLEFYLRTKNTIELLKLVKSIHKKRTEETCDYCNWCIVFDRNFAQIIVDKIRHYCSEGSTMEQYLGNLKCTKHAKALCFNLMHPTDEAYANLEDERFKLLCSRMGVESVKLYGVDPLNKEEVVGLGAIEEFEALFEKETQVGYECELLMIYIASHGGSS